MNTPDPIPVEVVRPQTWERQAAENLLIYLFLTPTRALILWWMLHYLPGPDLNYWQSIAALVAFSALFGAKDFSRSWIKGRKPYRQHTAA